MVAALTLHPALSSAELLLFLAGLGVNEANTEISINYQQPLKWVHWDEGWRECRCRENTIKIFIENLIKFHLSENQFLGLKVIQLIRAYVGSA